MRTLRLELLGLRALIAAPEEALDLVAAGFPGAAPAAPGEAADRHYTIEVRGSRWRLSAGGESRGESATAAGLLPALEYELERALTRRCRAALALHAGCVAVGDRGVLIAGDSGCGKTSTAMQLLELGHRFVAEELTAVGPRMSSDGHPAGEPEGPWATPMPRSLALERAFVERVAARYPVRHGEIRTIDAAHCRYLPARRLEEPVPLATVLLPSYRRAAAVAAEEVAPEAALPELLGYCFEPAAGTEATIDRVISLVERTRVLRLSYGGIEAAREALAELFGAPAGVEAPA